MPLVSVFIFILAFTDASRNRWWISKYILRQNPDPLEPLYKLDSPATRYDHFSTSDKAVVETGEHVEVLMQVPEVVIELEGREVEPALPYRSGRARMNF